MRSELLELLWNGLLCIHYDRSISSSGGIRCISQLWGHLFHMICHQLKEAADICKEKIDENILQQ